MKKLTRWPRFFLRWARILGGRSYYHQPQRLGKVFKPNELAGYFNDLTCKTQWAGETDENGIPVNILANGCKVQFSTTIVQKALGHWDKWLLTRNKSDKEEFMRLCHWLFVRQDERGGWPVSSALGMSVLSPYSAMTQGECVSAFVRAWKLTNESHFAEGARKALDLLLMPIEKGGSAIYNGKEIFLEETPSAPCSSILNGWIFALFGLYDYWLAFKDRTVWELFHKSLNTLKRHLYWYDTGYWSYYDILGNLASTFYLDLHIHQLSALAMVDKDLILIGFRDRWIRYQFKWSNRIRAFFTKAIQKLLNPGEVVIIK